MRPVTRALIVPADADDGVRLIDVHDGDTVVRIQEAVGRRLEAQSHAEALVWTHENSLSTTLPLNTRMSYWVLHDSLLARRGKAGDAWIVYGNAVITGRTDEHDDITDVSPSLVDYFQQLHVHPMALADWDIRSIIGSLSWFECPDPDDPGPDFDLDL
jgi:hypothetical protein